MSSPEHNAGLEDTGYPSFFSFFIYLFSSWRLRESSGNICLCSDKTWPLLTDDLSAPASCRSRPHADGLTAKRSTSSSWVLICSESCLLENFIFPSDVCLSLPLSLSLLSVKNFYNFLGQPNSLTTLDLSNTDCSLDLVSAGVS